jgi:hypothetical protein
MANKAPQNFMVPGEVHAAVLTGRAELVDALRRRIESGGEVIEKEIALQLCDLVKEGIQESQRDRQRRERFTARLRDTILGPMRAGTTAVENAIAEILPREDMPDHKMKELWDSKQVDEENV